jgi:peptide-methionine (S)-S-oxide reductase
MKRFPTLFAATLAGFAAAGIAFVSHADDKPVRAAPDAPQRLATAVFAGGCFWCVESDFDKLKGVVDTVSGYTGGRTDNPTYKEVSREDTGHYEAVKVTYDPTVVSYAQLTDYFLRHVDPTDADGQFCDRGESYRTAIFVARDGERTAAEAALVKAEKEIGQDVVTPVIKAAKFFPAEDYHQDYYKKNPVKYKYYRTACGRDARVKEIWNKDRS